MPSTRAVALHEASHAASLLVSGLPPLLVRVDNYADEPQLGRTKPDWERYGVADHAMREVLISILSGPICDGEPRLDDWPILPDDWMGGNRRDAEQAGFLCDVLHFDQVDYLGVVYKADRRAKDLRYRRLVIEIANALEDRGLLLQPELLTIAREVNRCSTQ